MKYPDQEARERRERAKNVAAWSNETGVFLFGAGTATMIVGFVMIGVSAGKLAPGGFIVYLGGFLFCLGSVVQYLGPRLF